jgi:hypothetical protein
MVGLAARRGGGGGGTGGIGKAGAASSAGFGAQPFTNSKPLNATTQAT